MTCIGFRFPSGRYHATPWGRHVNEGAVEWPPSPWRIVRALLATGFTRLHWKEGALDEDARALILGLAAATPRYFLPPAGSGHSRHYMPKYDGATTKVFDTFAYLGRSDTALLVAEYPIELPAKQRALLAALLELLPYLGRAESWVWASLLDGPPTGQSPCVSSETPPGPGLECVRLLAPLSNEEYSQWRHQRAPPAPEPQAASKRRGKGGGSANPYPDSLLEALCADTRTLQKQGWSQPPGTRWLSYWVRADALAGGPASAPRVRTAGRRQAALLAVASNTVQREVLPLLSGGVRYAEALHGALVRSSMQDGRPSPCFTGKKDSGERLLHHQHASIWPMCLDGHRAGAPRIDHFLVWCPMAFDVTAERALEQVSRIWAKDLPEQFLTLVGFGGRNELAQLVPQFRQAQIWDSCMPYVPPRFLKSRGRNTLDGQVRDELRSLGRFPEPLRVEVELRSGSYADAVSFDGAWPPPELGALATRWRWFKRRRLHPGRQPPSQVAFGLRITFPAPVEGPISIGYGAHFGLGQLVPRGSRTDLGHAFQESTILD